MERIGAVDVQLQLRRCVQTGGYVRRFGFGASNLYQVIDERKNVSESAGQLRVVHKVFENVEAVSDHCRV